MSAMSKLIAAGAVAAAVAIAGGYAFAQQEPGSGHGRMGMGPGMMKGTGPGAMGQGHGLKMGNLADPSTRLAALKTEIGIRPDQNAAWDAYAKVVTDTAAERRDHREHSGRGSARGETPDERPQHFMDMQQQRDAAAATVAAAAETLLATLDDAQRTKARAVLPGLAAAGDGGGMQHGMMGGKGHGKRH